MFSTCKINCMWSVKNLSLEKKRLNNKILCKYAEGLLKWMSRVSHNFEGMAVGLLHTQMPLFTLWWQWNTSWWIVAWSATHCTHLTLHPAYFLCRLKWRPTSKEFQNAQMKKKDHLIKCNSSVCLQPFGALFFYTDVRSVWQSSEITSKGNTELSSYLMCICSCRLRARTLLLGVVYVRVRVCNTCKEKQKVTAVKSVCTATVQLWQNKFLLASSTLLCLLYSISGTS